MRHPFLSRRGFTLIELLTVIAIIGILASISIPLMGVVKTKARVAASKVTFQQLCTAVEAYKTEYSLYPYINNQYEAKKDTFLRLNNTTNVTQLIKALSGRQPIWDGAGELAKADSTLLNKKGTTFYTFSDDLLNKDDSGVYTKLLGDRFGNTDLRLLMDTDGNGMVKPTDITGTASDYGIDSNGFINRRVVIYTLKSDKPTDYQDVLSWQ